MYFVLVPKEITERRGVFLASDGYEVLPDGRSVVPINDVVRFTRFSYGKVEIINEADLTNLRTSTASESDSSTSNAY